MSKFNTEKRYRNKLIIITCLRSACLKKPQMAEFTVRLSF